jgi:hypothetical protein
MQIANTNQTANAARLILANQVTQAATPGDLMDLRQAYLWVIDDLPLEDRMMFEELLACVACEMNELSFPR